MTAIHATSIIRAEPRRYRRTTTAARPSESKPGIGLVHSRWEATNQRGETVMTMEGWGMFGRRPG